MYRASRLKFGFSIFFLQLFLLSNEGASQPSRLPRINLNQISPMAMAHAQGDLRGIHNARYEKIGDNLKCDEQTLSKTSVATLSECQMECTRDDRCNFMAYWVKRKRCETYVKCESKSPDGDNKIILFRRIDECKEMIKDADAPFYIFIAAQFPPGVVRPKAPRRNLACFCTAWNWMICAIFLVPQSGEFTAVLKRLDRSNEARLKPFYTAYPDEAGRPSAPMMISYEEKVRVYAEIEPIPFYRCGTVAMCKDGTPDGECPVDASEFVSGQAVFILKTDEEKVVDRQPIPCISAVGIRVLASIHGQDSVMAHREVYLKRDPFGRQPGKDLIVGVDYIMIFIFDDHDLRSGICGDDSHFDELETTSETTSEQPFQEDHPEASPEFLGRSSPRKGKSRGGGKKKKKASSPPELEVVPSGDSPTPFSLKDESSGFQSFIARQKFEEGSKSPEDDEGPSQPIIPSDTSPEIAQVEPASEKGSESDDPDAGEESPKLPEDAGPSNIAAQSSSAAGSSNMHAGVAPSWADQEEEEDSTEWNVVSRKVRDSSNAKGKGQQSQARPSPRMRPSSRLTPKQANLPLPASQSIIPSRVEAQERRDSPRTFLPRGDAEARGDSSSSALPRKSSWASIAASGVRLDSPVISPEQNDTPSPSPRPTISQSLDKRLDSISISPKKVDSPQPTMQPTPSKAIPAAAAEDSSPDIDASEYHQIRKAARKRNKKVPASFLDDEPSSKSELSSSPKSPVSGENVVVSLDSLAANPLVDKEPADRLPIRNYQSSLPGFNRPHTINVQVQDRPPPVPRTQEKSTQDEKPQMQDKSTQWEEDQEEDHVSQTQNPLHHQQSFYIFTFFSSSFIIFTYILTSMLHNSSHDVYVEFEEVA